MSDEAIQLNDLKVTEGNLLDVYNKQTSKFSNAKKTYKVAWVQDCCGEKTIMFTDNEIEKFKARAAKHGLPSTFPNDYNIGHLVTVLNYIFLPINTQLGEIYLLMTQREVSIAITRAYKNPEDIPSKSFLTDLLD
jgi:hypothetical protein